MKLLRDLADEALGNPSILSIGVFDGVHLGHQYLIGQLMESAQSGGYLSGVVTFDRHPDELLDPEREMRYLTTLDEKLALLGALGLDFVVALPFTRELSQTTARDFVRSLLAQLHMRQLWVGPDFALGRGRQGSAEYLLTLAAELGFELHAIQPLSRSGTVISSSIIRTQIREGRMGDASLLLGRFPAISGMVVTGAHRGRDLGFPTANLALDEKTLVPASGVYAARIQWDGANHGGVVNIGRRPTFEDRGPPILEAHVLDFAGDLYGKQLRVEFVERLRSEQRFESADALVLQMRMDVLDTRRVLLELESR